MFVWPVGGSGTVTIMRSQAETIATEFGVPVFATQQAQLIDRKASSAALIDGSAQPYTGTSDIQMDLESVVAMGYTGSAFVRYLEL